MCFILWRADYRRGTLTTKVPTKAVIPGLNFRFCAVFGKWRMSRGTWLDWNGTMISFRLWFGWEWDIMIWLITIWGVMGLSIYDQKRPNSQLTWFCHGEVPRWAQSFVEDVNLYRYLSHSVMVFIWPLLVEWNVSQLPGFVKVLFLAFLQPIAYYIYLYFIDRPWPTFSGTLG